MAGIFRISRFPAGSASSPGIHFGDGTTGFYRPGADQIGVTVGGTQRGLWSASGLTVTGDVTARKDAGYPIVASSAASATATHGAAITVQRCRGTHAAPGSTVNGDALGNIVANAYRSGYVSAACIRFEQDGDYVSGMPGAIKFMVASSAGGGLGTAMTISSTKTVRCAGGFSVFNQPPPTTRRTITGSRGANLSSLADVVRQMLVAISETGLYQDATTI